MMGHIRGPADARPREAIRVAVADTRHLIAEALGALVATMDGLELVEVFDGTDALPTIVSRHPDVLLVGIGGDSTAALELVRSLRRIALNLEIVLVQLEVLTLVAEGCSYDEIGARLFISATPSSSICGLSTCALGSGTHGGSLYAHRARRHGGNPLATRSKLTRST